MKLSNIQILLIRLAIGGLFLNLGLEKYHEGWFTDSGPLMQSLQKYFEHSAGLQRIYLAHVALPYSGVWAKLIVAGELSLAISFLLGLLVRFSAGVGMFMMLNFHAANGNLFSQSFFSSPWGALLLAGTAVLFLARAGRWVGIDYLLARSNASGILW